MNKAHYHPWLRPLWRRLALIGFCAAWTAAEMWRGDAMWSALVGGLTLYGAWIYLLRWSPPEA